MAFPTAVNSQITDAVTQTNVKVLGEQPAKAGSDQSADENELRDDQAPEGDRPRNAER